MATLLSISWQVLLELPQLEVSLTSRQFYITLDVIRNVLLASPVKLDEDEEDSTNPSRYCYLPIQLLPFVAGEETSHGTVVFCPLLCVIAKAVLLVEVSQ